MNIPIWQKIWAGDELRISRFHDLSGELCDFSALAGVIPAGLTWLAARFRKEWVKQPWWVWSATKFVQSHLLATDKVLEIGSGYSSIWLSKRCSEIATVEESLEWKTRIEEIARRFSIGNIEFIVDDSFEGYRWRIRETPPPDVVVIDASSRKRIFESLMSSEVKPRIIIYDDTDRPENREIGVLASVGGYQKNSFRGFKPECLHVCETTVLVRTNTRVPREANPASTK